MGQSYKKNIVYNSIYRFVVIVTPLITSPYISRVLGAENIGVYTYCNAYAMYFVICAMMGVSDYGNRKIAQVRDCEERLNHDFSQIMYLQLFLGGISTLVYLITILFFNTYFIIRLVLVLYVMTAAVDINWFAFGIEEFKFTSIRSIICRIFIVVGIFTFVHSEADLPIYVSIIIIGNTMSIIPVWFLVRKKIQLQAPCIKEIFQHLKPNLVLFLPVVATTLYQQMDKLMLGVAELETEVGYYQNAENIVTLPTFITSAIVTVMLPFTSNMIAKGKSKENIGLLKKTIEYSSAINIAMMFGLMAIADIFIPWYLGPGYERSAELIIILAPIIVLGGLSSVIRYQLLIPDERDKIFTFSIICGAIINIIINFLLIPCYQAVGAAIATVVSYSVVLIIQMVAIVKDISIVHIIKMIVPYIMIGGIMYIGIKLLNSIVLIAPYIVVGIDIVVGCIFYGTFTLIWMHITKDSVLDSLKRKKRNI